MPELILDYQSLQAWLPHRGANLFIDQVWANAGAHALTLNHHHSCSMMLRSREILMRQDASGRMLLERTVADGVDGALRHQPAL